MVVVFGRFSMGVINEQKINMSISVGGLEVNPEGRPRSAGKK